MGNVYLQLDAEALEGNKTRYDYCTATYLPLPMRRSTTAKQPWSLAQFQLHKLVYQGVSSRVYIATDKQSGIAVALKYYKKSTLDAVNRFQVEREINIHITVEHENIIKLYAAFEDEKNIYMIQELAGGGDLFHKVKKAEGSKFEEKSAKNVIISFLDALTYLHRQGVVHRDIKPENILLTSEGVIKLADFGLAINLNEERAVTRLGTLDYMAPEVLVCPDKVHPQDNKEKHEIAYAEEVDVWAVGVLAYELLVGSTPFEHASRRATLNSIITAEPEFPVWMSLEAKSFIKAALCKEAGGRPNVRQLSRHPWLQGYSKAKARRGSTGEVPPQYTSSMQCSLAAAAKESFKEHFKMVRAHSNRLDANSQPSATASPSPSLAQPPAGVLSDNAALRSMAAGDTSPPDMKALLAGYATATGLSHVDQQLKLSPSSRLSPASTTPRRSSSAAGYLKIFSKLWGGVKPDTSMSPNSASGDSSSSQTSSPVLYKSSSGKSSLSVSSKHAVQAYLQPMQSPRKPQMLSLPSQDALDAGSASPTTGGRDYGAVTSPKASPCSQRSPMINLLLSMSMGHDAAGAAPHGGGVGTTRMQRAVSDLSAHPPPGKAKPGSFSMQRLRARLAPSDHDPTRTSGFEDHGKPAV